MAVVKSLLVLLSTLVVMCVAQELKLTVDDRYIADNLPLEYNANCYEMWMRLQGQPAIFCADVDNAPQVQISADGSGLVCKAYSSASRAVDFPDFFSFSSPLTRIFRFSTCIRSS